MSAIVYQSFKNIILTDNGKMYQLIAIEIAKLTIKLSKINMLSANNPSIHQPSHFN